MKKLDLKDNGIGNTGPMALADSLRSNKVLQRLDISDNGIDGPKAVTMIKALWECKSLTHLNLSDNQFGGIDSGSSVFPEGLPKNTTFERLVSSCRAANLNTGTFLTIVESLEGTTYLRELYLGENFLSLDDSCGAALKQLLKSTSLRQLHLYHNYVTSEAMTDLVEGLQINKDEVLLTLGECLVENKTLESLALEENEFDAEGLSLFFLVLPRMKGLKKLVLKASDFSDETVGLALVDGIRVNTSLEIIESIEESELPPTVKESIEFYLQMNRNGRRYLRAPLANRMPMGVWPHISTKLSPVSERDQLFYFLRHKADLVQSEMCRKRKAHGPASSE